MHALLKPPPPTPSGKIPPPKKRRDWTQLFKGEFLILSILVHVLFGIGAAYYVVQTITTKQKIAFQAGPPAPATQRAIEHKVQMQKKKTTLNTPVQARRVVTTGLSRVSLPDAPMAPTLSSPAVISGVQGNLSGLPGPGKMGTGSGGFAMPFFGLHTRSNSALEGTFYDFRMQADGKTPVPGININTYLGIIHDFDKSAWQISSKHKHFTSPKKLYASHFLFPAIVSTEAGQAFQSPTNPDGLWLAHYKGSFATPQSGRFRFVGFGDNVLLVRVDNTLVLDASDHNPTGHRRDPAGNGINFPKKGDTPLFFGEWFQMQTGANKKIEIVVGDEGGIFCAGLFIQMEGVEYKQGANNAPLLPLFTLSPITEADKESLRKYLPEECLSGMVFTPKAGIFGDFNH